jgi:threonine/homoserine/homoserine lactone efflux protein
MESLGILHLGAFVAAGLLLNLTPGPDLVYTSTQAGLHGARAGWIAALGIGAGGLVHVTLGALGVSALIATSAAAFEVLKLVGAAWLVWLGLKLLLAREAPAASPPVPHAAHAAHAADPTPGRRAAPIFRDAVLVSVLNPKVALFFLAFVPQFIDPASPRPALAFVALGAVFVANGTLVTGAVGTLTAAAAASLRSRRADRGWRRGAALVARALPRAIGALFIGLGLRLALAER